MSTDATQTVDEINAANDATRTAQAAAIAAEANTAAKTAAATAKKTAADAKKAAAAAKKTAAAQAAAAKKAAADAKKAAAAVKTPSRRSFERALATEVIAAAEAFAASYEIPEDSPMDRNEIFAQVGKWMSYIPGDWPTDPKLPMITAAGRRTVA